MDQKGILVKLIIERSTQNAGTANRVKGEAQKGNSTEESGRYLGKISGGGNSLWIVTKVMGNLVKLCHAGDRALQLLLFNEEFLVSVSHQLTLITSLWGSGGGRT